MIAWQTSSTVAARCIGLVSISLLSIDLFSNSVKLALRYRLVFKYEEDTQLTRTPNRANSRAVDFVSISNPAFDMQ